MARSFLETERRLRRQQQQRKLGTDLPLPSLLGGIMTGSETGLVMQVMKKSLAALTSF